MPLMRPAFLLCLVLAWLTGCGPGSPPPGAALPGTMRLAIALPAAAPGDVARVTVTVTGADMSPRAFELNLTDGVWGGVMSELPAGRERTFVARAFDASSVLRHEGRAEDVTITAGAMGLVSLQLQDLSAPSPFTNEAPLIDSLVANPITVAPGGTVSLVARTRDPNAGDSVSHAWTAPSGAFSPADQASTLWTAPAAPGRVTLTLTVSDSRGAALTRELTLNVSSGQGAQDVKVDFNRAPTVGALTSSQSYLDVGQQTALAVTATDADIDPLSYQWSATCAGGFTGVQSPRATFTPSAIASGACNNCQVRVVVKDGRGGQNTGSVGLCLFKGAVWKTQGSWNPAAPMSTRRTGHQATLLANGTVLVSGGYDGSTALASAEVYDPATGAWSPTGSMSTPRSGLRAVRLAQGKVLVWSGRTAEVYDPATGTWSPTGAPRPATLSGFVLLADGRVLSAGGYDDKYVSLTTAEVYDPATGTWSPTGSMLAPRYSHVLTRLADGRVLLAGGVDGGNGQVAAQVYDPSTGTWSLTGSLASTRRYHTLTLLPDGRLLVAGGTNSSDNTTTELYDPFLGNWRTTGRLVEARTDHRATLLLDGRLLVSGGQMSRELLTTEVYAPATGIWSAAGRMAWARAFHTATLLPDGKVLVTGGSSFNNTVLSTTELYDPGP